MKKTPTSKMTMNPGNSIMSTYYALSLKINNKLSKKRLFRRNSYTASIESIIKTALAKARYIKNYTVGPVDIFQILDEVIPTDYFGLTKHRKIFYMLVKKILTQSVHECIYSSTITSGFHYRFVPWLAEVPDDQRKTYLLVYNVFMLDVIVKPLIRHFYCRFRTYRSYEIKFIHRSKWQSFRSKVMNSLLKSGYLVACKDTPTVMARGVLKIIPKDNCATLKNRIVTNIFHQNPTTKLKFKCLSSKIKQLSQKQSLCSNGLFDSWKIYTQTTGHEKIYAIKVDIEDAFGNVDIDVLCSLIENSNEDLVPKNEKQFLLEHIRNQYVVSKCNEKVPVVYQWKHGLLQGDRLSSCLCDLYMSYLDRIHLREFISPDCFLHRTVDDFFFCSTRDHKISRFLEKISCIYTLNNDKTTKILENSKCTELLYCGYLFNITTKEVRKCFDSGKCEALRHRFKLWNINYPILESNALTFLKRAMTFNFNNNSFSKLAINLFFNTKERVLMNFFDGMCFLGIKFDSAFVATKDSHNDYISIVNLIEDTIREYCNRILQKLKRVHGGTLDKQDVSFNLLYSIGLNAFILVMKKRHEVYKDIILEMKQRCNLYLNLEGFKLKPSLFKSLSSNFAIRSFKRVPYIIS